MRRKIELWIGTLRADLADDSFILMNYTMEDLTSPAVVRNSFSKQITIPGTTANNRIFGEIFRNDRVTQYSSLNETGTSFDPTRKTSWRIYNEKSEIVDSGYLRLDSIIRRRNTVVEYKVTLYGGLGSFLYGLSYDENGNKRTLDGLNFIGGNTPATEFNFTLNATAVRAAWTRIAGASGAPANIWDFINFAPCYNGKPSGTFDAGKGMLDVVAAGIGTADGTVGGLALVDLAQEYTEWETKDLRSYLQRPVVRLRSIIEAACASRNNGGWTVTLDSAFFNESNPYWQKTWMTLPIIDTDNILVDTGSSGALSFSEVGGNPSVVEANIVGGGDPTKVYNLVIRMRPYANMQTPTGGTLYLDCEEGGAYYMSYVQFLINCYDANNTLVESTALRISSRQPATEAGDVPRMDAVNTFTGAQSYASWNGDQLTTEISAQGVSRVRVTATTVALKWGTTSENTPSGNAMWTDRLQYASMVNASSYYGDFLGSSYSFSGISGGRSGKTVTKAELLSGGGTPADYLLALCKTFGLVMVADQASKTVSIMLRRSFYTNEIVDIHDRIDTESGYEKQPFAFNAKWYVWAAKYESGEWAKSYADKYGRTFGQQRIDTGYDFDANTTKVLDGVIFHGAVMALECEKYFCNISENGYPLPSVLLDRGAKYSVVESATTKKDIEITLPSASATITWMNPALPSYDVFPKAQFHDKDNAAFDERDTLLFFDGMYDFGNASPYTLTDDTPTMLTLNEGTPCWLLQWAVNDPSTMVTELPMFSRYLTYTGLHQGYVYERSLDFGTPAEVPIPGITFLDGSTIWPWYFSNYIADRYDDDSAVVRCKVNLSGMQVGPDLMRNFYWFDGAVWALNRIINHSVTTDDLTECEFVKVQDVDNYTT